MCRTAKRDVPLSGGRDAHIHRWRCALPSRRMQFPFGCERRWKQRRKTLEALKRAKGGLSKPCSVLLVVAEIYAIRCWPFGKMVSSPTPPRSDQIEENLGTDLSARAMPRHDCGSCCA